MQDGKKVANLSVATSESWKDKATGEKKEKTEWHRIVIFGNLADIAERYLKKGSKVYIEGSIQTRKWSDKDGVEKYSTEIVLQGFGAMMTMIDTPDSTAPKSRAPAPQSGFDDDIPF